MRPLFEQNKAILAESMIRPVDGFPAYTATGIGKKVAHLVQALENIKEDRSDHWRLMVSTLCTEISKEALGLRARATRMNSDARRMVKGSSDVIPRGSPGL